MQLALSRYTGTAAMVAALGWCVYQAVGWRQQHAEFAALAAEASRRTDTLRALRAANAAAGERVAAARAAVPAVADVPAAMSELEQAIHGWLERSRRLQQLATERSDLAFPERGVLSDDDWFNAAREAKLDSEDGMREALRAIRDSARNSLGRTLQAALSRYADAHDNRLPAQLDELLPFTEGRVTAALLARYELQQQGNLIDAADDVPVLAERPGLAPAIDNRLIVTRRDYGVEDGATVPDREVRRALRAFRVANGGRDPADAAQLLNYFQAPLPPAALQGFLEKPKSDFAPDVLHKLLPRD